MSTTATLEPGGALGAALTRLDAAVDGVAAVPAWRVGEQALPGAIRALARAETRVAAARLTLVREASDRGVPAAAGTTPSRWLRGLLRESPGRAADQVRVADALRDPTAPIAAAVAAGEISVEHATVITRVLGQVRADGADAALLAEAEVFLLGQAREVDPARLAMLGRHLRYVADPAQGDDRHAFRERLQTARRELTWYEDPDGSGMTLLRGRLDPLGAATVAAALDPLAAPRPAEDGARDARSAPRRRADALVELCQRALADGGLPTQGGERPTLIVTIGLAMLLGLLKAHDVVSGDGTDAGNTDSHADDHAEGLVQPDNAARPDDAAQRDGHAEGDAHSELAAELSGTREDGAQPNGHGNRCPGGDGSADPTRWRVPAGVSALAALGYRTAHGRVSGLSGIAGIAGVAGVGGLDGSSTTSGLEWLPARLASGQPVSASTVRRLACDAGIIPLVLGSASEPLDIGRRTRIWPAGIRRAVTARDGGCSRPGCDVPAEWCQIHHIRHWADGGRTSLANAVMVCDPCHDLLHHGDWTVHIGSDGHPVWIPPPWLDPDQLPKPHHWRHQLNHLAADQARRNARQRRIRDSGSDP